MLINETKLSKENAENYSYRFTWLHLMRPLTLTGSICPILAGTALAYINGTFKIDMFIFLIFTALLIQAGINMLNDYFDFLRGQEHDKWILQADGLAKGPMHHHIPYAAFLFFIAAAILGLWLAVHSSYWIIIIGMITFIIGYAYQSGPRPLSSIGLGELDAAICYGPVPIILAYFVQGYSPDAKIIAVSVPFSLLIASMILSNNIRDMDKDQGFRRTLAMLLGRVISFRLLVILLACSYLWVIALIYLQILPWTSAACLLALPFAIKLGWSYRPHAARKEEMHGMKLAAMHHWMFGLSFAFGIWVPAFLSFLL